MSSALKNDIPIVFILAKGRSGTTLLQTMLDAHPEIVAPFESRFVVHFQQRYLGVRRWTKRKKEAFIKDVISEMKISFFWELDIDLLRLRINDLPENSSYGLLCKQVYLSNRSFFTKGQPKVIIDKNPIYALLVPLLLKVFPDARFIHTVRDFRANCASFLKFQPYSSIKKLGHEWNLYNTKIEAWKDTFPERFHFLKYEALVQQPKQVVSAICDFLGIDFQQSMLLYHQVIKNNLQSYIARSPSEAIKKIRILGAETVHKNLTTPLNPALIDNWKHRLSIDQIKVLEITCGFYGTQYGYLEKTAQNVSFPKPPFSVYLHNEKLYWYYSLPIWFRELKNKPDLALIPNS